MHQHLELKNNYHVLGLSKYWEIEREYFVSNFCYINLALKRNASKTQQ